MQKLDDLMEDLSREQKQLLERAALARINWDASEEAYLQAVDKCVRNGMTWRMLGSKMEVSHTAIFRHWRRWKERRR